MSRWKSWRSAPWRCSPGRAWIAVRSRVASATTASPKTGSTTKRGPRISGHRSAWPATEASTSATSVEGCSGRGSQRGVEPVTAVAQTATESKKERPPAVWDDQRQCYAIRGKSMPPGNKPATGHVHERMQLLPRFPRCHWAWCCDLASQECTEEEDANSDPTRTAQPTDRHQSPQHKHLQSSRRRTCCRRTSSRRDVPIQTIVVQVSAPAAFPSVCCFLLHLGCCLHHGLWRR